MSEENLRASMNLREKQALLDSVFDFMRGPWENRSPPFLPAIFYQLVIQKANASRSDVACGSKSDFKEPPTPWSLHSAPQYHCRPTVRSVMRAGC